MAAAGVVSGKVSNGSGWCGCSWPVVCGWRAGGRRGASEPRRLRGSRRVTAEGLLGVRAAPLGCWVSSGLDGSCSQAVQASALFPGSAPRRGSFRGLLNPFLAPETLVLHVCPSDCRASSCKSLSRRQSGLLGLLSFGEGVESPCRGADLELCSGVLRARGSVRKFTQMVNGCGHYVGHWRLTPC